MDERISWFPVPADDDLASMYNFTNRLSMATGMLPNREYHAQAR